MSAIPLYELKEEPENCMYQQVSIIASPSIYSGTEIQACCYF